MKESKVKVNIEVDANAAKKQFSAYAEWLQLNEARVKAAISATGRELTNKEYIQMAKLLYQSDRLAFINELKEKLKKLKESLSQMVSNTLKSTSKISNFFKSVGAFVKNAFVITPESIIAGFRIVFDYLSSVSESFGSQMSEIFGGIKAVATGAMGDIIQLFKSWGTVIYEQYAFIFNTLNNLVHGNFSQISTDAKKFFDTLKEEAQNTALALGNIFNNVLDNYDAGSMLARAQRNSRRELAEYDAIMNNFGTDNDITRLDAALKNGTITLEQYNSSLSRLIGNVGKAKLAYDELENAIRVEQRALVEKSLNDLNIDYSIDDLKEIIEIVKDGLDYITRIQSIDTFRDIPLDTIKSFREYEEILGSAYSRLRAVTELGVKAQNKLKVFAHNTDLGAKTIAKMRMQLEGMEKALKKAIDTLDTEHATLEQLSSIENLRNGIQLVKDEISEWESRLNGISPNSLDAIDRRILKVNNELSKVALYSEEWHKLNAELSKLEKLKDLSFYLLVLAILDNSAKEKLTLDINDFADYLENELHIDAKIIADFDTEELEQLKSEYEELKQLLLELLKISELAATASAEMAKVLVLNWLQQLDLIDGMQTAFGGFNSVLAATGDESREAAVAMLALAIAELVAALASAIHNASKGDPYTMAARIIAAGAAVTAAIASAAATTHKFALGGIVSGLFLTGDRQTISVNAGEMVLTNALQRNLFDLLDNGGVGGVNGNVEFKIKGKDLVGVLSNTNRYNSLTK